MEIPFVKIDVDEPTILLAVGLNEQDPHEPTGVTILGIGTDYEVLAASVQQRFHLSTESACWTRGEGHLGDSFGEIAVVEVPVSNDSFELTITDADRMRKEIEKMKSSFVLKM